MASFLAPLKSVLRMAVSGDKQRFDDGRVNLDLSYITDRIIAMGFPGEGVEGTYRNSIDEVATTLDLYHKEHYSVYNLAGRGYDVSKFGGRVITWCSFPDHHPPSLVLLARILLNIHAWLMSDPRNIVVIHCLAGKGRTGTVIASYMLLSGLFQTANDALSFFALKRSISNNGVTVPGQRRYVKYMEDILAKRKTLDDLRKQWMLQRVTLRAVPIAIALAPVLTVYAISGIDSSAKKVIFSSLIDPSSLPPIASQKDMRTTSYYTVGHAIENVAGEMPDANDELIDIIIPVGVLVRGDLLITVDNGRTQQILRLNMHTGWIEDTYDAEIEMYTERLKNRMSIFSRGRRTTFGGTQDDLVTATSTPTTSKSTTRTLSQGAKECPCVKDDDEDYDDDEIDYDVDLYQMKKDKQKQAEKSNKGEKGKEGNPESEASTVSITGDQKDENTKTEAKKDESDSTDKKPEEKEESDENKEKKEEKEDETSFTEKKDENEPEEGKTKEEEKKEGKNDDDVSEKKPDGKGEEEDMSGSKAAAEAEGGDVSSSSKSDKPMHVCVMSFQKWELDGGGVRSRFPSTFRVDIEFLEHAFTSTTAEIVEPDSKKIPLNCALKFQEQKYDREAHGEYNIVSALNEIRGVRDGTTCFFVPEVASSVPSLTTQETPDVKVAHARSQAHGAQQQEQQPSQPGKNEESIVEKCGWLVKQGHNVRNWKRRWFVLRPSVLEYYASPKDANPRGVIKLADICAIIPEVLSDPEHPFCFEIIVLFDESRRVAGIASGSSSSTISYRVCAADSALRIEWVEAIDVFRMEKKEQLLRAERDQKNKAASKKKANKDTNLSLSLE